MKKFSIYILACTAAAAGIVMLLFLLVTPAYLSSGGFQRRHVTRLILGSERLDLGVNSYYLRQAIPTGVYLANHTVDGFVMFVPSSLHDSSRIYYQFSKDQFFSTHTVTVVDSPYVHFLDGLTPAIASGLLDERTPSHYHHLPDHFNQGIPFSPDHYIVRTVDTVSGHQVLSSLFPDKPEGSHHYQLPCQSDGIFGTDGMLAYAPSLQRILYVYYYQNLIVCLDTNLTEQYQAHTIDTTTTAHLHVATLDEHTKTLAGLPLMVNLHVCVDGDYLYVHSGLMADNEDPEVFSMCSVIDVYAIRDGSYRYSFYIQDHRHQKIHDMVKRGGSLYVLYDHDLVRYKLDSAYEETIRARFF